MRASAPSPTPEESWRPRRRYLMRMAAALLLVGAVAMNAVSFYKLNAGPDGDRALLAQMTAQGGGGQVVGRNARTTGDIFTKARASPAVARAIEKAAESAKQYDLVSAESYFVTGSGARVDAPLRLSVVVRDRSQVAMHLERSGGAYDTGLRLSVADTDFIARVPMDTIDREEFDRTMSDDPYPATGADFEPVLRARFDMRPEDAEWKPDRGSRHIAQQYTDSAYIWITQTNTVDRTGTAAWWRHDGAHLYFYIMVPTGSAKFATVQFGRPGVSWAADPSPLPPGQ